MSNDFFKPFLYYCGIIRSQLYFSWAVYRWIVDALSHYLVDFVNLGFVVRARLYLLHSMRFRTHSPDFIYTTRCPILGVKVRPPEDSLVNGTGFFSTSWCVVAVFTSIDFCTCFHEGINVANFFLSSTWFPHKSHEPMIYRKRMLIQMWLEGVGSVSTRFRQLGPDMI